METRANFVLIGAFTLAVIAGAFGFVLWFQHHGTAKSRVDVRVIFDGPVAGLRTGANVNFNGIRVGEVRSVKIDDPAQIVTTLSIEKQTPIRKDTTVGLEFAGLTGVASVALKGGRADSPELEAGEDGIQVLTAELNSSQDMSESARAVLQNLNKIVLDNQETINATLKSLQEFAATLNKNSARLDNVMIGVESIVGKDGKGDLPMAIKSFKELADNLDTRTAEITTGINRVTRDTLGLITDGRKTMGDLGRAINNFDRNPSRVLFGGSSSDAQPEPRAEAPPPRAPAPRRAAPAPAKQ